MAHVSYTLHGYCRSITPERAALDDPVEWFACRTYLQLLVGLVNDTRRVNVSPQKIRTYGLDPM